MRDRTIFKGGLSALYNRTGRGRSCRFRYREMELHPVRAGHHEADRGKRPGPGAGDGAARDVTRSCEDPPPAHVKRALARSISSAAVTVTPRTATAATRDCSG